MAKRELPIMTDEDGVDCAWCPSDEEPQEGQSHGICNGHATIMRMRRQAGKVPSAIEENATQERRRSLFQW